MSGSSDSESDSFDPMQSRVQEYQYYHLQQEMKKKEAARQQTPAMAKVKTGNIGAENSNKASAKDKHGALSRGAFNFEQGQDNRFEKSNFNQNLDHKSAHLEEHEEAKLVMTEERK